MPAHSCFHMVLLRITAGPLSRRSVRGGERTQLMISSLSIAVQRRLLADVKQLDVKDKSRIRRYRTTGSTSSVAQFGRNSQLPFASNLHSCNSFIPALDHLTASQRKREWLATIEGTVELLAVCQPSGVMHL